MEIVCMKSDLANRLDFFFISGYKCTNLLYPDPCPDSTTYRNNVKKLYIIKAIFPLMLVPIK